MGSPAIFLDRDGTIIDDTGYLRDPKKVRLLEGAAGGLRLMREKGYSLFVVSNQSGVGRGKITDEEFLSVHTQVCSLLKSEKVEIDAFAYCLHHPEDGCSCRKPAPGLFHLAAQNENILLRASLIIGNSVCDLNMGCSIGVRSIFVGTKTDLQAFKNPVEHYDSLLAVAETLSSVL